MRYIFDASFVGALIIPDEINPHTQRMYTKIKNEDERHSPHLLWYEISSIFRNLIRNKRYTSDEVFQFYPLFSAFRLTTDIEGDVNYSRKLLQLSNNYNLSCYDAAYLELAERKNAVLCTLDNNLKSAAQKHGVAVLS